MIRSAEFSRYETGRNGLARLGTENARTAIEAAGMMVNSSMVLVLLVSWYIHKCLDEMRCSSKYRF